MGTYDRVTIFLRKQISNGQLTFRFISGVTILLSLTVFSQVLADTMPATSDAIPLLGNLKTVTN